MQRFSSRQLERYPVYLKLLKALKEKGMTTVSSPVLAEMLGYSEEMIRKDFQAVSSSFGVPKKGRDVDAMIEDLESFLGYKSIKKAILFGVGHMGGALLRFHGFADMGLEIVAGIDVKPELIGTKIEGKPIRSFLELPALLREEKIEIAILCVPSAHAQEVAESLYDLGIKAIWNFAPVVLSLPIDALIENVNLASSFAVLSHRLSRTKGK